MSGTADEIMRRLERDAHDWHGRIKAAVESHRAGRPVKSKHEDTWRYVFDPSSRSSQEPICFAWEDVAAILAEHRIGDYYGEEDIVGVFLLKSHRFAVAGGSCDTTGWGCQDGVFSATADSFDELWRSHVDESARARLRP